MYVLLSCYINLPYGTITASLMHVEFCLWNNFIGLMSGVAAGEGNATIDLSFWLFYVKGCHPEGWGAKMLMKAE